MTSPLTNSDVVFELTAGETATFDPNNLNLTGHYAVVAVEVVNTGADIATVQFGGGPTRSIVVNERYTLVRNVDTVKCISGTVEVVFLV